MLVFFLVLDVMYLIFILIILFCKINWPANAGASLKISIKISTRQKNKFLRKNKKKQSFWCFLLYYIFNYRFLLFLRFFRCCKGRKCRRRCLFFLFFYLFYGIEDCRSKFKGFFFVRKCPAPRERRLARHYSENSQAWSNWGTQC